MERGLARRGVPGAFTAVEDSEMRAFGIGLPLAAELRRGHWNRLAAARNRGRLVRIVEGQPVTGRHHTHTLLDETEERTRTVNAVSLPGRL